MHACMLSATAQLNTRSSGWKPPAEQYAEIDARLMLLHQKDMVDEYKRYAKLYLDNDIAVGVRGFCELRLIRLGEALYMPLKTRLILIRADPRLAMMEANAAMATIFAVAAGAKPCLLYTSPSPRDRFLSRMPSSA